MHSRKPLRLKTFDYSTEGVYFVTVCTHGRSCFLGQVERDLVRLSKLGAIVEAQLERLPARIVELMSTITS